MRYLTSAIVLCFMVLASCATVNEGSGPEVVYQPSGPASLLAVEGSVSSLCRDVLGYDYPEETISYWNEDAVSVWVIVTKGKHGSIKSRFTIENGQIAHSTVLASREQRGKAVKSRGYLKQFKGLSLLKGKLSGRVDAITGATHSSKAMESAALLALRLDAEHK